MLAREYEFEDLMMRQVAGDSAGRGDSDGETKEESTEELRFQDVELVEEVEQKEAVSPSKAASKKKRKRKKKKKKKKKKAEEQPPPAPQIDRPLPNVKAKKHDATIEDLPLSLSTSLEDKQEILSSRKKIRQRAREERQQEMVQSTQPQQSMTEYSTQAATGSLKRKKRTPSYLDESESDEEHHEYAVNDGLKRGDRVYFKGLQYSILKIHWKDGTAMISREKAVTYARLCDLKKIYMLPDTPPAGSYTPPVPFGWSSEPPPEQFKKPVIQNPSVPPFLRGDQVWRKGSQCTVIKVDMEGVPPSCIVKVNSTGAYADTELALLHPCKFEIFDYILRTMCPACEKIGIVRNINESKQTVDYTICNTDEMITNVPFHKIQKAIIPKEARRGLVTHPCVYRESEHVLWNDEESIIIHMNVCELPPTVMLKVVTSGYLIYTDVHTLRKLPQRRSQRVLQNLNSAMFLRVGDKVLRKGAEGVMMKLDLVEDPLRCVVRSDRSGRLISTNPRHVRRRFDIEGAATEMKNRMLDFFTRNMVYYKDDDQPVLVHQVFPVDDMVLIQIGEDDHHVVQTPQLRIPIIVCTHEETSTQEDAGERAERFLRAIHTPKPGTIDIVIGKEECSDLQKILEDSHDDSATPKTSPIDVNDFPSPPSSDSEETILEAYEKYVNTENQVQEKSDPTKDAVEGGAFFVQSLVDSFDDSEPKLQVSPGIKEDIEATEIDTKAIISGLAHLQGKSSPRKPPKETKAPLLDLFEEVLEARKNALPFPKKEVIEDSSNADSLTHDSTSEVLLVVENLFQGILKEEAIDRVEDFCEKLCPDEFNPLCRLVFLEMLQGCVKCFEMKIPYIMDLCVDPFFQVDQDKCDELVKVCSYLLDSCKIEYENDSQELLEKYFMHNKFPEESAMQLSHLDTLHKFWKPDQAKNCHINIIRALHQLIKKYPVDVPQRDFFEKVVRIFCETYFEGDESNDWTGLLFTFVIDFMCSKRQGEEDWEELRFSAQMIDYIFTLHPNICEDEGQAKFDKIWVYQQMGQCHESLWKKAHRIQNVLKADKYYFLWCLAAINYKHETINEGCPPADVEIITPLEDSKAKRKKYDVLWLAVMTFGHHIIESRTTSHIHRTFKQLIEKVSGRCLGLFLKCYGEYLTRNHPEHEKRGFQCMSQANELLDVKDKDEVFYSDLIFIAIANNKIDYARRYLKKGRKKVTKHVKDALRSKNKRTTYLEFYRKSHRRNNLERLKRFKEKMIAVNSTMVCELCGNVTVTRCGACKAIAYCCTKCSAKDWPRHKMECKLLAQFVS